MRQFPGGTRIDLRQFGGIPVQHPLRVSVVIIGAGNKLTAGLGKPECLAGMSGHRHRAAVLDRDTENLRLAGIMSREFIAEGGRQYGPWRTPVNLGGSLRRINFGALVDVAVGTQQVIVGILDVVNQAILGAIKPDVTDHAMPGGHRTGGQ